MTDEPDQPDSYYQAQVEELLRDFRQGQKQRAIEAGETELFASDPSTDDNIIPRLPDVRQQVYESMYIAVYYPDLWERVNKRKLRP